MPSITGICISINTAQYVFGAEFSSFSAAITPFSAQSTASPRLCISSTAISALRALSSARRTRFPLSCCLSVSECSGASTSLRCSGDAGSRGISTVNTGPFQARFSTERDRRRACRPPRECCFIKQPDEEWAYFSREFVYRLIGY